MRQKQQIRLVVIKTIALAVIVVPFYLHGSALPENTKVLSVAPGCAEIPKISDAHHIFFIDPVKGDLNNDGSKESPWRTLAEVLDPRNRRLASMTPGGAIQSGDVLVLMNGNHGSVSLRRAVNESFISVVAGPGQAPVLESLSIAGSSRWVFRGLKIQSPRPLGHPDEPLVGIGLVRNFDPASDIVLVDNNVSTVDDSSEWKDSDWVNTARYLGIQAAGVCITIANNHLFNLRNALLIEGHNELIDGNKIEYFGNDGIEMIASDLIIRRNLIMNGHHTNLELLHPDGIQGWTAPNVINHDILIDSNTLIKIGDPKITSMQGISIFDGMWNRLTIINNVVVTNHWHGIALLGVKNALIANNTVVPSSDNETWITVDDSKDHTPSENIIVKNNISPQILIKTINGAVDHNIATFRLYIDINGEAHRIQINHGLHGMEIKHAFGNVIVPKFFETLTKVDFGGAVFDLRPQLGSPAVGEGDDSVAPPFDIIGARRKLPVDIGAYAR